ncbi:MAG: 5'/3'-nucleotidase SurE [Desulfobacterales bacterium]
MNILLTNDDGIQAEGLRALYRRLARDYPTTVVAPERERSAVSHSITLHKPLRLNRQGGADGVCGYAVSGTPADCVKLGVLELLERRPDLVVSGINPGANVGLNLNYSGTVSAAKEAALLGLPAIAVSVNSHAPRHYDEAADFIARLAELVWQKGLPDGTFLNVNLPDLPLSEIAGVRISRQGVGVFSDAFEKRTDPRNRVYFWQGCDPQTGYDDPEIDGGALNHNFISICPLQCDMTAYDLLDNLRGWPLAFG